jgi:peptidoglycan biosynthesis protein MviN/MurJ (putative lipid II flippase)
VLTGATYAAAGIGLVSQALIYRTFGLGEELDAYIAALALPTALATGFNNALRSVLIPSLKRWEEAKSEQSRFVLSIGAWGMTAVSFVALALLAVRQPAMEVLFPGFTPETTGRAVSFFSFLVLTLPLSAGIGVLSSLLLSQERFFAQGISTLVPPLVLLTVIVTLTKPLGSDALIVGTLTGAILQFALLVFLASLKHGIVWVVPFGHPEAIACLRSAIPLLLSNLTSRSGLVVEKMIASAIGPGVITAVDLSRKVGNIAGQVVTNLNLVSFPELSSLARKNDLSRMRNLVRENQIIILAGYLAVMTAFFAVGEVVVELLTAGRFHSAELSTKTVADLVTIYVAVACTASLAGTITYWFYAREKTLLTGMVIVASIAIMVGSALILLEPLGPFALAVGGMLQNGFIIAILTWSVRRGEGISLMDSSTLAPFVRLVVLFGGSLVLGHIWRDFVLPLLPMHQILRAVSLPVVILLSLAFIGSILPKKELRTLLGHVRSLFPGNT